MHCCRWSHNVHVNMYLMCSCSYKLSTCCASVYDLSHLYNICVRQMWAHSLYLPLNGLEWLFFVIFSSFYSFSFILGVRMCAERIIFHCKHVRWWIYQVKKRNEKQNTREKEKGKKMMGIYLRKHSYLNVLIEVYMIRLIKHYVFGFDWMGNNQKFNLRLGHFHIVSCSMLWPTHCSALTYHMRKTTCYIPQEPFWQPIVFTLQNGQWREKKLGTKEMRKVSTVIAFHKLNPIFAHKVCIYRVWLMRVPHLIGFKIISQPCNHGCIFYIFYWLRARTFKWSIKWNIIHIYFNVYI